MLLSLMVAACAAPATPLLRLPPSSLERPLALQQLLTAEFGSHTERLEVLLEADAQTVRVALLSAGQTGARLAWDGRELRQTQSGWWPPAVSAERVLSDLQFVLWPEAAVRAALPLGWTLGGTDGERLLRHGGDVVMRVRYLSASRVELEHLRERYRIVVETRDLGAS